MTQLEKAIEELNALEEEARKKRRELERLEANSNEIKKMAIALHDRFCHQDHTEYCGWFYEIKNKVHDWSRSEHQHWYNQAFEFKKILLTKE